jgi:alpha-tubulin suppressor-like RCC1 family protein
MSKFVLFMRKTATIAPPITSSGSVRNRGIGRAIAFGTTLVVMLGVSVPSPVDAVMVQAPATSDDQGTGGHLFVAGTGASAPQIATGMDHTCALLEDRTVRCWGFNSFGWLGDGTTTRRLNPVQVLASGTAALNPVVLSGVTQITAGDAHTCALLEDKTVRCWGRNGSGRLGDGTTEQRLNPVQVLASGSTQGTDVLGGVAQITAGNGHTCALLEDKTIRCWGFNRNGQLGDGTLGDGLTEQRLNPVQVLASGSTQGTDVLGGVAQITAGDAHTCALLEEKTIRCWGFNLRGQLGDGTTTQRLNPVQVLASGSTQGANVLGGVTQVAAGNDDHTCALLEDKTVRCWGDNQGGKLGDGTTDQRFNPVQVLASGSTQGTNVLGGVTQVAAGNDDHTCALLEDKTVSCWGYNGFGALGDGTTTNRLNPVQVLASGDTQGTDVLGGVTQIATGRDHTCARLDDKTARCWGFNSNGELGDGTQTQRLNPVQVLATGTAASDPVVFLFGVVSSSSGSATVSLLAVGCDGVLQVGLLVTCTVTGGDPGIDVLWRAAYNPVFAEAGVTLDASGAGEFSFVVPAAALGAELTVELVEWLAPISLGVVGGPVPSSVPSGGGPVPVWSLVLLALAGGLALRRMSAVGVRG